MQREDAGEREHDRRTVFDGLRYIVKTGAPWRWMPNDFPPGAAVDQQAERWLAAGRKAAPTAAIIDSRTPRSTHESAGRAGYDQGKRRKGSKIHRAIDTLDGLIRVGRIRYEALSDVSPDTCRAMATQAEARGAPGPTALMTPYSLVRHSARTIGTSLRAGSYGPDISAGKASPSAGRGRLAGDNPLGRSLVTDRNGGILDALRNAADEIGRSPANAALIRARRTDQLDPE